ncbi:hypothetical protein ACP3TI_03260 [Desulforudis sp. 1190]|uniref:primosomal protein N' family DNA-binding protein n=1 Tax=Desulforudis sp. 1190 TaxID=3416136 RepID=UPI003CF5DB0B
MASGTYAQVIVDLPVANVDKVYHYGVPEQFRQQVTTGARVLVPFGRRKLTGYVVGISSAAGVEQVKDILAVLDAQPAFTPELLALARWLAERYLCTISEAIAAVAAPTRKAQPRYRWRPGSYPLIKNSAITTKRNLSSALSRKPFLTLTTNRAWSFPDTPLKP